MKYFLLLIIFLTSNLNAQVIQVNRNYTPTQLVKDIFLGTDCIEVDENSIEINGFNNSSAISYGYFEKGSSNFPLQNGIILSSGNIMNAVGPNNSLQSFTQGNWEGDRDLEGALDLNPFTTFDATTLEFDFISHQNSSINFDYIFASEQYLLRANEGRCGYTDGFAFLIKEYGSDDDFSNIALIPNTTLPVSVNTIFGYGGLCNPINPQYFGQFNYENAATNFNGETVTLTATTTIIPGKKYHLKLVIADQGNGLYDSAVFFKAKSFTGYQELGPDLLVSNGNAPCQETSITLDATNPNATDYKWFRNGTEMQNETNKTLLVSNPGNYEVQITLSGGCIVKGNRRIEYLTNQTIITDSFKLCDDHLDGFIPVVLNQYTAQIVNNSNENYLISYHSNRQDAIENSNPINQIALDENNQSMIVYIRIQNTTCSPTIYPINFSKNQTTDFTPIPPIKICSTETSIGTEISLEDYIDLFNVNFSSQVFYFATENDAKMNNNPISSEQIINTNSTFYARFKTEHLCDVIAPIPFIVKQIIKSEVLIDQIICKNTTTTLDAGIGFDSYLWLYNNATTSVITNVTAGIYQVRLEKDGCFYIQTVTITTFPDPIINAIDIQGTTVIIKLENDDSAYLYALDGGSFQSSNTFTNVTFGNHDISIKLLNNPCDVFIQSFRINQITNFITPNNDGINDQLNLAFLLTKENPIFKIYDRYGMLIFKGSVANNFIWNGTINGKKIKSDSYWYNIQWREPKTNTIQRYASWIMLKNM